MWTTLLNVLFPKRCVNCHRIGAYLCETCFSYVSFHDSYVCPMCLRASVTGKTHPACLMRYSLDGLISSYVYQGPIKRLLYKFKYKPFLSSLKDVMGKLFEENLIQNELFFKLLETAPFVTSIPLHPKKEKLRGYNHAALLGSHVAQYFSLEFYPDILMRTRETKPQFQLSKEARISNIRGAFSLNKKYEKPVKGKTIFIVDDLATTCTTLREAANVLKRNGAKAVWGVTFAKEL